MTGKSTSSYPVERTESYGASWSWVNPIQNTYKSLLTTNGNLFSITVRGRITTTGNTGVAKVQIFPYSDAHSTDLADYVNMSVNADTIPNTYQAEYTFNNVSWTPYARYPLRPSQRFKAVVFYGDVEGAMDPEYYGPQINDFYVTDEFTTPEF